MNILQAIEAMRRGARVRRRSNVGRTVASCWLELDDYHDVDTEVDDSEPPKVIYFVAEPITAARNWVQTAPGVRNEWKPSQDDLFADDFEEVVLGTPVPDSERNR